MSGDFQVGEWRVQPAVNRLKRDDQVVRVEPKVMQVLVCLAEQAGEVVTREELIARVWPDVFVTDDVLHRAVRELRRVFGDSTSAPRYIETIRKRGYRLMIPATAATEPINLAPPASAGGKTPQGGTVPPAGDSPRGGGWQFSLVAAGAALAIAGAVLLVASRSNDLAPEAHARFVPIVSGPLNESDPALSPDGRRVAYVLRDIDNMNSGDIYIRDLADGRVTRVTDDPASDRKPAWSPDGSRLAFIRERPDGACDIVITTIAAARDSRIARCGNADDPALAWTADGRALLTSVSPHPGASSGWQIGRIDLATGSTTLLTQPPGTIVGDHSPAVSTDGRHVAFIRRASGGIADVYTVGIDGSNLRRLTFDEADLTGLDWTSDGRTVVYSSDRAGGYSLWRIGVDGGTPLLLAGGAARMKHPVADRTSRRVVYENWNYDINVWQTAVNPDGAPASAAHAVTRSSELWNLYPQVSPDGAHIAYVSTQSGSHELWVANRDGSNPRQMTHVGRGVVKSPRWSPDSRRIVYLARGEGAVDVQHVDITTGAVTSVTSTSGNEVAPAWSHDGTRIYFGATDPQGAWHVWSVDVMGGDARVELSNAVAAQPSHDGDALYYTRPAQPGVWRRARAGAARDTEVIPDVAAGSTLGWLVTAGGIYFVVERDEGVYLRRVEMDGRDARDVATLTQFTWPGFSITPDGRGVFYARWDRRDSNLMSIQY